jgi:hypothetical protein
VMEWFIECNSKTGVLKANESKKEAQSNETSKESTEVHEPFTCP